MKLNQIIVDHLNREDDHVDIYDKFVFLKFVDIDLID